MFHVPVVYHIVHVHQGYFIDQQLLRIINDNMYMYIICNAQYIHVYVHICIDILMINWPTKHHKHFMSYTLISQMSFNSQFKYIMQVHGFIYLCQLI